MSTTSDLNLPREGFVRPKQVAYAFGVCRSTLYNYIRDGIIPPPIKDYGHISVWPVSVIRECLAKRGGSIYPPDHQDSQPIPAS